MVSARMLLVVHNLRLRKKEYAVFFHSIMWADLRQNTNLEPLPVARTDLQNVDETCGDSQNDSKSYFFSMVMVAALHSQFLVRLIVFAIMAYENVQPPEHILRLIKEKQVSTHGGHADELEASSLMAMYPELVKPELASVESGEPKGRLSLFQMRPGIFWYADYPNHYAGEASNANPELGKIDNDATVELIVQMIRSAKTDNVSIPLQNDFYRRAANPKVEVH